MRRALGGRGRRIYGFNESDGVEYLLSYDDMVFTRASEAAAVDPRDGWSFYDLATPWLGVDVPRITPDGLILIEGPRTNLVPRARDLNVSWSALGIATVTAADRLGPDGLSLTADRVQTPAGSNLLRESISGLTIGTSATVSAYIAARDEGDSAHLSMTDDGSNFAAVGSLSTALERKAITLPSLASTTAQPRLASSVDRTAVGGLAAGARDMVADLVQFEAGSFASSPIRTSGAAATRAADTATFAVGDFDARLLTERTRWRVWPGFASSIWPLGSFTNRIYRLGGGNWGLQISGGPGTGDARVVMISDTGGPLATVTNVTFEAGQALEIVVDPVAGAIELSGFTTRNGTYPTAGGPFVQTATSLEIGRISTTNHFFGLIGRPEAA